LPRKRTTYANDVVILGTAGYPRPGWAVRIISVKPAKPGVIGEWGEIPKKGIDEQFPINFEIRLTDSDVHYSLNPIYEKSD